MGIHAHKEKLAGRLRLKKRLRKRITGSSDRPRLSVFKSSKHIYVQAVADDVCKTLLSASTLDKDVQETLAKLEFKDQGKEEGRSFSRSLKSRAAAKAVGLVVAGKAKELGITKVIFDRNGFLYHGRVQAVADGAREGGLEF